MNDFPTPTDRYPNGIEKLLPLFDSGHGKQLPANLALAVSMLQPLSDDPRNTKFSIQVTSNLHIIGFNEYPLVTFIGDLIAEPKMRGLSTNELSFREAAGGTQILDFAGSKVESLRNFLEIARRCREAIPRRGL